MKGYSQDVHHIRAPLSESGSHSAMGDHTHALSPMLAVRAGSCTPSAVSEGRYGSTGSLRSMLVKRTWPGCGLEGGHCSSPLGPKTPELPPHPVNTASAGQHAHGQPAQGVHSSTQGSIGFPAKRSRMGHSAPAVSSWGKQQQPPSASQSSSGSTAIGLGSQQRERQQPNGVPATASCPTLPASAGLSTALWNPQASVQQVRNSTRSWPCAGAGPHAQQRAGAGNEPRAQSAWSSASHAAPSAGHRAWPEKQVPGQYSTRVSPLGAPAAWPIPAGAQPVPVLAAIGQPAQWVASSAQHRSTAPAMHAKTAPAEPARSIELHESTSSSAGCRPGSAPGMERRATAPHASAPSAAGRGGCGSSASGRLSRAQHPAQPGAQPAPARSEDIEQRYLPARSPPLRTRLDQWDLPCSVEQVRCTLHGPAWTLSARLLQEACLTRCP